MNRPLVWAALAHALGVWCGGAGREIALGAAMAGGVFLFVAMLQRRRSTPVHTARIGALFFAAGLAIAWIVLGDPAPRPIRTDTPEAMNAVVREAPLFHPETDYASLIVDTADGKALVRWSDPEQPVYPGDRIRLIAPRHGPLGNVNFGISGYEEYLRRRGVRHAVSVRAGQVMLVERPAIAPGRWLARLREAQSGITRRSVPEASQPFLLAVWLGDRTQLTDDARDAFVRSGTAHLLAVSGLHVGLVFVTLQGLLVTLRARDRTQAVVIVVAVFAFALMTGGRVSSLRAATMISLFVSARLVRREPDAPTALGVASLLFLSLHPALIRDAGFLLSFGAVASLLLYSDPLAHAIIRRGLPPQAAQPVAACLSVQVLTWPLAASAFYVLPLAAPLVNLLVVPLLAGVLWLNIVAMTLGAFLPEAGVLAGHALHPLVQTIVQASRLAGAPVLSLDLTPPTTPALGLYYAAALLPLMAGAIRKPIQRVVRPIAGEDRLPAVWIALACGALLAFCAVLWRPETPRATVDFLDVSHSDATVVYPPEGGVVLVDGGDRSDYVSYGKRVVLPSLRSHGVRHVDVMVATHADRDHIGGLKTVLENMSVGTLVTTRIDSEKPLEQELMETARAHGVPVRRMSEGDFFTVGGATFEALHPPDEYTPPTSNDTSLVLRMTWRADRQELSLLLPGDLERDGERLVARSDCRAEILKAGHHGSATSSSATLLDAVRPRHTVVSTRRTGRLGAIGQAVEERFEERGIRIWRTDLQGGIRLTGPPVRFETAREQRGWVPAAP